MLEGVAPQPPVERFVVAAQEAVELLVVLPQPQWLQKPQERQHLRRVPHFFHEVPLEERAEASGLPHRRLAVAPAAQPRSHHGRRLRGIRNDAAHVAKGLKVVQVQRRQRRRVPLSQEIAPREGFATLGLLLPANGAEEDFEEEGRVVAVALARPRRCEGERIVAIVGGAEAFLIGRFEEVAQEHGEGAAARSLIHN